MKGKNGKPVGRKPAGFVLIAAGGQRRTCPFLSHKIAAVIHLAGFKAIGESLEKPLKYYYNNTVSTMTLAEACIKYDVKKFVFSSSATVYGENKVPFVKS